MIEARDVRVTRGGVSVLAGVSCAVRPGELVMLAGGNGAGKSTLARLLCASDLAEPGMVRVDDEDPQLVRMPAASYGAAWGSWARIRSIRSSPRRFSMR